MAQQASEISLGIGSQGSNSDDATMLPRLKLNATLRFYWLEAMLLDPALSPRILPFSEAHAW